MKKGGIFYRPFFCPRGYLGVLICRFSRVFGAIFRVFGVLFSGFWAFLGRGFLIFAVFEATPHLPAPILKICFRQIKPPSGREVDCRRQDGRSPRELGLVQSPTARTLLQSPNGASSLPEGAFYFVGRHQAHPQKNKIIDKFGIYF